MINNSTTVEPTSAITINKAEQQLVNEQSNLSIGSASHQPGLSRVEDGAQHSQLLLVCLELFLLMLMSKEALDRNQFILLSKVLETTMNKVAINSCLPLDNEHDKQWQLHHRKP
jgi:hypothetical protein